jgi:hypothetical protein
MRPMSSEYGAARRHVQRLRSLYRNLGLYLLIVFGLALVNGLASPSRWWVQWPALGLALAASFQASLLFVFKGWLGQDWQERKVQQILNKQRGATAHPFETPPGRRN